MNPWAQIDRIKRQGDDLKSMLYAAGFTLEPADFNCNWVAKNRQRSGEVFRSKTAAALLAQINEFRRQNPLKRR